jgi:hypothetical protein
MASNTKASAHQKKQLPESRENIENGENLW